MVNNRKDKPAEKPVHKTEQKSETKSDTKSLQKTEPKTEEVTLEQALKEEGEGRTVEGMKAANKKTEGPTKVEKATKIMKEMWADIQSGKVKRKDVVKRFVEEADLSKAGASTYYGNIKKKLLKAA